MVTAMAMATATAKAKSKAQGLSYTCRHKERTQFSGRTGRESRGPRHVYLKVQPATKYVNPLHLISHLAKMLTANDKYSC